MKRKSAWDDFREMLKIRQLRVIEIETILGTVVDSDRLVEYGGKDKRVWSRCFQEPVLRGIRRTEDEEGRFWVHAVAVAKELKKSWDASGKKSMQYTWEYEIGDGALPIVEKGLLGISFVDEDILRIALYIDIEVSRVDAPKAQKIDNVRRIVRYEAGWVSFWKKDPVDGEVKLFWNKTKSEITGG